MFMKMKLSVSVECRHIVTVHVVRLAGWQALLGLPDIFHCSSKMMTVYISWMPASNIFSNFTSVICSGRT